MSVVSTPSQMGATALRRSAIGPGSVAYSSPLGPPMSIISASDYEEISAANRDKVLVESQKRSEAVAHATVYAEQTKFVAWARQAVPLWLRQIPALVAQSLKAAMKSGKDVKGVPAARLLTHGQHSELAFTNASGGIFLRYARVLPHASYADLTHFPGVADEAFLWHGRALRDYPSEGFTYSIPLQAMGPGMAGLSSSSTMSTETVRAFQFLDVAAAAAGLPSVSAAWETMFPGFSFELGRFVQDKDSKAQQGAAGGSASTTNAALAPSATVQGAVSVGTAASIYYMRIFIAQSEPVLTTIMEGSTPVMSVDDFLGKTSSAAGAAGGMHSKAAGAGSPASTARPGSPRSGGGVASLIRYGRR